MAATCYDRLMASGSGRIDDKLAYAAVRALQDGNLTPIIKEELRLTIQSKRLKKGQDELSVTFREPSEERVRKHLTQFKCCGGYSMVVVHTVLYTPFHYISEVSTATSTNQHNHQNIDVG